MEIKTLAVYCGLVIFTSLMTNIYLKNGSTCESIVKYNDIALEDNIDHTNTVHWTEDMFSFVPPGKYYCADFYENGTQIISEALQSEMAKHKDFLRRLKTDTKAKGQRYPKMGHTYYAGIDPYSGMFWEVANHTRKVVKSICETGFNEGHSSIGWLTANKEAHIYSFDLGKYSANRYAAKRIMDTFPGRFTITWGETAKTLPKFHTENPEVKCDLIIVDAGHRLNEARLDILYLRKMARYKSLIILDNYPDPNYNIGMAWERAKRRREINELFRCIASPPHKAGLCVGWVNMEHLHQE